MRRRRNPRIAEGPRGFMVSGSCMRLRRYRYRVLALEIDDVTSGRTEVRGRDLLWAARRPQAGETLGTGRYTLSVGHGGAHLVIDGEEDLLGRKRAPACCHLRRNLVGRGTSRHHLGPAHPPRIDHPCRIELREPGRGAFACDGKL